MKKAILGGLGGVRHEGAPRKDEGGAMGVVLVCSTEVELFSRRGRAR